MTLATADARELAVLQRLDPARLSATAVALEASLLSEDLDSFVQAAWHVLEPGKQVKWGWATEAICEHLTAVTDGQIKRLLINVPPGMMKSLLVNVFWPAWEWTLPEQRHLRYLGTAHKQDLAVRDNMKARRLIQSAWYQRRWQVKLTSDQNAKTKFENSQSGFREAMAFGSMTGSRGDRVLLDDPLSVDSANSEADLASAETTFTEALPTRVNDDDSAIIVIMQRLAENDTSGIIIDRKLGYEHLMLPMEFEKERRCVTSIGFRDPRKKDGELLFPERFPRATVDSLKMTMGQYAVAGQLQQRPSPRGGGMFKDEFLELWPHDVEMPDLMYLVQSYDTAFTDNTANDPTACTVWGVFKHHKRKLNCAILVDAWDEHLTYPKLRAKVVDDWTALYGGRKTENGQYDPHHPARRADALLVEDKGSGISLIQDLRTAGAPAQKYNPGKADKYGRASQALPLYEMRLFYVFESAKEPGTPVKWARPFVKELSKFGPGAVGGHDDYVDTLTQTAILLRDQNWLALPEVVEPPEEERDYHEKSGRNPYA